MVAVPVKGLLHACCRNFGGKSRLTPFVGESDRELARSGSTSGASFFFFFLKYNLKALLLSKHDVPQRTARLRENGLCPPPSAALPSRTAQRLCTLSSAEEMHSGGFLGGGDWFVSFDLTRTHFIPHGGCES